MHGTAVQCWLDLLTTRLYYNKQTKDSDLVPGTSKYSCTYADSWTKFSTSSTTVTVATTLATAVLLIVLNYFEVVQPVVEYNFEYYFKVPRGTSR